jgi:Flp pilus assembly protein TadD
MKRRTRIAAIALALAMAATLRTGGQQRTAPPDEAMRRNNLGVGLMDAGTKDPKYLTEAVREFEAALRLAPSYATARLNLGVALYYAGDTQRSGATLEQVIGAEDDSPHAHYVLGLLREYAGRHEEAARHFRRVADHDPSDPDSWYHLAFNLSRMGRQDDAIAAYRRAAGITPYQRRIRYGLFLALTRAGRTTEAQAELEAFRSLGDSQIRVVDGPKNPLEYLKQGRYAEALADSVVRPAVTRAPVVVDVAAQSGIVPAMPHPALAGSRAVLAGEPLSPTAFSAGSRAALTAATSVAAALVDVDNDGLLDVYTLVAGRHSLFAQRPDGTFAPMARPAPAAHMLAAAWGDLDNDDRTDLVVAEARRLVVYTPRQGRLVAARTAPIPLPAGAGVAGLALADVDHDGDLDIIAAGGVDTSRPRHAGVLRFPDDFERRPNLLLRNNSNGTFTEIGGLSGLADAGAPVFRVWFGDVDDDRAVDAVFVDARGGQRVLRNRKDGTFAPAPALPLAPLSAPRLDQARASGDVNRDGAVDELVVEVGAVRLQVNQSRPARWLTGRARGFAVPGKTKSNRLAIGARLEVRSAGLWDRREIRAGNGLGGTDAAEITFDLGREARLDFVRAVFPSGVRRTDTGVVTNRTIVLEEPLLDVNSCPTLFTWNGGRFEFITDTLSAGILGELVAPGEYWRPDPDEWVRIEGRQLVPDAKGRLSIRFVNPLEEVTYLDAVRLVAVDHPPDTEVYTDERMLGAAASDVSTRIFALGRRRPPARVIDHHGHDVSLTLGAVDRRYFDHFTPQPFKGFAGDWALTIDLGTISGGTWPVMGLDGWSYWNSSAATVAAAQAGQRLWGPTLEVQDIAGRWRLATDDLGLIAGLPRTMLVDLRPYLRGGEHIVRIRGNRTLYYDRIWVAEALDARPIDARSSDVRSPVSLPTASAMFRWLGYPRRVLPDGALPDVFDYQEIEPEADWGTHAGLLTRYGDVRPLVAAPDSHVVVMGHGEELALEFDASAQSPLRAGWQRTYFFYGNGFEKGYEISSAHADTVGPLPFQGMRAFPFSASEAPDDPAYVEYQMEWNTRPPFLRGTH